MTLPQRPIAFAGGIAFLLFAVWTWREGRRGGDDDVRVAEPRYVLFAIISSFVLAELGDKTMLATVALASDHNWAGVWIGATVGMVLADGVASVLFLLLGRGRCAGGRCRQRHPQASRASGHVDSARIVVLDAGASCWLLSAERLTTLRRRRR